MANDDLTRPTETAEYFKISERTLLRWRSAENFPQPIKRGRIILYSVKKIKAWLKEQTL